MKFGLILATGILLVASSTGLDSAGRHPEDHGSILHASAATSAPGIILWRDRQDFGFADDVRSTLALGEGRVFYLRDGSLVAADLVTGRPVWRYGTGLKGPVVFGGGRVYAVLNHQQVVALSTRAGGRLWLSPSVGHRIDRLFIHQDLLLANSYWDGGMALDAATGRVRWRISEQESLGPAGVAGNLLLDRKSVV